MRNWSGWWIIIGIMLLVDLYVFSALKSVTQNSGDKTKLAVYAVYWTISGGALLTVILFPFVEVFQRNIFFRNYVFAILVGFFFAKLIASSFFLVDDLRRGAVWLMGKIFPNTGADFVNDSGRINRSVFFSWAGFAVGGGLFTTLLYGFSNKSIFCALE